jgi:hypothetical protein
MASSTIKTKYSETLAGLSWQSKTALSLLKNDIKAHPNSADFKDGFNLLIHKLKKYREHEERTQKIDSSSEKKNQEKALINKF